MHPGESGPSSHYRCHCEAEGRGDRRDCHGATPLAMTWKFSTGPSDDRAGAAPPTMNGGARDDRKGRPYAQRCGSGPPGRGGPTADLPEKNEKMSTEFENSVDKSREKALASPSIGPISRRNRKKLHRLFKVCGDSVVPDFLLTLPEDLAILFMKSGATGSRFPTECYKK